MTAWRQARREREKVIPKGLSLSLVSIPQIPTSCLASDREPFYLIEGDLVTGPVVELGRPRRLVVGHRLRLLERPAVLQVDGDPGRPEAVAADERLDARLLGAPADHPPHVRLAHRVLGELLGL